MAQGEAVAGSETVAGLRVYYDGREALLDSFAVPEEVPVAFVLSEKPYAVMMASPSDLEDFAFGFCLTEGVIESRADIKDLRVSPDEDGFRVDITLAGARFAKVLARQRNLSGRTSCGLCGITDKAELKRQGPDIAASSIDPAKIGAMLSTLEAHQPLNQLTRAVHGAAFFDANGRFVAAREDVGRHNALDKLIGALMRQGVTAAGGHLVITSRCSFEMVEKAAMFGAPVLIAVSAPTRLALERAKALGITLVAIARRDGAVLFNEGR
jgi:FdhD protein